MSAHFTTVWTYDIYRPLINSKGTDSHYVSMGRWTTVIGVLISVGTAYLVMQFASIMDYVQALFSFFIAPLFGTVILGMLWKRATGAGGFWGLLCGTAFIDRHVGMGQARSHRAALCSALAACQGPGPGYVPGALVFHRLRGRHCSGEYGDEACASQRIEGSGIWRNRNSVDWGCPSVREAAFLGRLSWWLYSLC